MCAQQPATMTVVGPQVMRVLSSPFFFFTFLFFFFSLLLDFFFFILNQVEERPFFFMSISGCHQGGRSLGPLTIGPSLMDHFEGLRKHFFILFLWLKHSTHNTIGVIDSVALFRPKSRPERSTQVVVGYTRGPIEENGPGVLLASRFFFFFFLIPPSR